MGRRVQWNNSEDYIAFGHRIISKCHFFFKSTVLVNAEVLQHEMHRTTTMVKIKWEEFSLQLVSLKNWVTGVRQRPPPPRSRVYPGTLSPFHDLPNPERTRHDLQHLCPKEHNLAGIKKRTKVNSLSSIWQKKLWLLKAYIPKTLLVCTVLGDSNLTLLVNFFLMISDLGHSMGP